MFIIECPRYANKRNLRKKASFKDYSLTLPEMPWLTFAMNTLELMVQSAITIAEKVLFLLFSF